MKRQLKSLLLVLSGYYIPKYHMGGLQTDIYFSQLWMLGSPQLRLWQMVVS